MVEVGYQQVATGMTTVRLETMSQKSNCYAKAVELSKAGLNLEAVRLCETSPCAEDANCQLFLGAHYVEQGELELAHAWYLRATEQGCAEAMAECWKLILRLDGEGSTERAEALCEGSICAEYLDCQRYLAKKAFERNDLRKTLRWSLKIAEKGGDEDILYVASIYRSLGEPQKALDFYRLAINAGSARANHLIGDMYFFGLGVRNDFELARIHYERSASQGFFVGRLRLLHLSRLTGGLVTKLNFLIRMPILFVNVLFVFLRDPEDWRLRDMPTVAGTAIVGL